MDGNIQTKPFRGERIVARTDRSFDAVRRSLREVLGKTTVAEVNALAKGAISESEFSRCVEERYVGFSGFMLFAEIDHSAWLPVYGITQKAARWILGNPLYAITMIRHDITAGLFVPVEVLIAEEINGVGATVTYVRPSSLMVVDDNRPLLDAAQALDAKLAALVVGATHGAH